MPELDAAEKTEWDGKEKTAGAFCDKPRYVDFHHRACALHTLAYSFKSRNINMPGWLVGLAQKVQIQWKGSLAKVEWLALGLGTAASLQHCQVKLSWIDIIQQVNSDSSLANPNGKSLQKRIYEISPEHAAKLNDWKNMQSLIYRVDPAVYTAMEDEMAARGVATPITPQT